MTLPFRLHDGGRAAAGFRGHVGDCATRAIALASGRPYREVYDAINAACRHERRKRGRSSARSGVHRRTYERYLVGELGAVWTPTMTIGSGCTHHLRDGEVPLLGRFVVVLSGHLVALVNGIIYDTEDPSRGGRRCVYGWYELRT